MKLRNLIANPFIVYAITWTLVLCVYSLGWSLLFPPLSMDMLLFLGSTIVISIFIGLFFRRLILHNHIIKPNFRLTSVFLNISIIFIFVEFIAAGHIPLISALLGGGSDYSDFGLPIIHVLVVNFMSFIFIYSFHCFRCTTKDDKIVRKKLIKAMLTVLIIFLLMFNRGGIMNCFIASGFIYFVTAKNLYKSISSFAIFALFVLFGFGLLGNLRTDTEEASNIILELGEATDEFKESFVPDPFFWAYIYITSPLSNFQHNVTNNNPVIIKPDALASQFIYEFTPQIISKRVAEYVDVKPYKSKLIVNYLNARTVYSDSFVSLGWWGPFFMYLFTLFFILVNIALVGNKSPYFITQLAIINSIVMLNIFSNMFIFMGTVPALLFPIIFSLKQKKRTHKLRE